ncbi:MAG: glycosyltransferase, partial [Pirellulales bacterium]
ARLVPKKGLDVLLRAMAQLIRADSTLRLEVVGEGPEKDALRTLASELQLDGRVAWHGAQDNHTVSGMMGRATLFVLPCRVDAAGDRDGIPVVLIEAMACGRCVVTGDLVTIRELVIHDQTGWLVAPGDVDALAHGLAVLLREPERRRRLSQAGRRHVEQAFSLTRNVARLQEAFRRAVAADRLP